MATEEIKEITVNEEDEIVEVAQEQPKKGLLAKIGNGVKKHGKKIAAVVALGAVAALGYRAGKKMASGDEDDDDIVVYYDDSTESEDTTD